MQASVTKDKLTIVLDFDPKGRVSGSGKSRVHASTRGNRPAIVKIDGKELELTIGINAYSPA